MNTLAKSAPLGTLGLPSGDHWVKFHVEENSISFEIKSSQPSTSPESKPRKPTGFVQKWGGSAKKQTAATDDWLTHINDKHLR